MPDTIRNPLLGFVAGALAVLIFHQLMYLLIVSFGGPYGLTVSGQPWRMNPVGFMPDLTKAVSLSAITVPNIINQMVWGGLWGALFGAIANSMPGGPVWVKALIFAVIAPLLIGSWLIVPLIRGQPVFSGFVPPRMLVSFLLNGVGFGVGLAILYPLLQGMLGRRTA